MDGWKVLLKMWKIYHSPADFTIPHMDQLHFIADFRPGSQNAMSHKSISAKAREITPQSPQSEIISLGPWQFQQWYILKAGHWFSFYRPLKSFQYLCKPGESSLDSLNNRFGFLVSFYHIKNLQKQPILQRSFEDHHSARRKDEVTFEKCKWVPASLLMSSTNQQGSRVPRLIISTSSSLLLVASSSWKTVRGHHHSLGVPGRLSWRPSSPK